jgi:predicted ATP-grasp superfamily ATP-dependent carboligase
MIRPAAKVGPALEGELDTTTPILVLRRSFAHLQHTVVSVARSAGRLGIPVYAVRTRHRQPAMRSRYVVAGVQLPDAPEEGLLEALLNFAQNRPKIMLLPIDDESAIFASDHRDRLAERFLMPHARAGAHRILASKWAMHELCRRIGVPAPESRLPSSEAAAIESAEAFGYPVVLKRSAAWVASNDPLAPSVAIVHSRSELVDCYRRMDSPVEPQVIVQEHIPGGSDSIWMFNGYFGNESRCLCAFTGQKLRQRGPRTGPTTLGVCVWNEAIASAAQSLLREVGYEGIIDMGFRYDARDGSYKLLDVNPRIGSTFRLFTGANGVDVVRTAYLDLTGHAVPETRARDGRRWIVEPYDLLTSAQLGRERDLTVMGWLRSMRGVEEGAWWAGDDPLPFLAMVGSVPLMAARYSRRRASPPTQLHSREVESGHDDADSLALITAGVGHE